MAGSIEFDFFLNPGKRIFLGYVLLSFGFAILYLKFTGRSLRRFFGRQIWLHPSAKLDYLYFFLSHILKTILVLPLLPSAMILSLNVVSFLQDIFGYTEPQKWPHFAILCCYTIALFISSDLSRYLLHRWLHRSDLLWQFHKVHHSARVLTPVTFYRVHPLEHLLFGLRYVFTTSLVTGSFIYFFGARLDLMSVAGVNIFTFISHVLGSNLRHSHVPFSYPKILELIFISPKQHQWHHCQKGCNTNYGGVFAIWDVMFRSHRFSENLNHLRFGLDRQTMGEYRSIRALLLKPFSDSIKLILQRKHKEKKSVMMPFYKKPLMIIILILCFTGLFFAESSVADQKQIKKETLGKMLFFDRNLSLKRTQSCADCHNPDFAFTDKRGKGELAAVSLGDDGHSLGDRNAPTLSYVSTIPEPHFNKKKGLFSGGFFWDGRAKNLVEQAGQPILNPIEMQIPSKDMLVDRILKNEQYKNLFSEVFTDNIFSDTGAAFLAISESLAAFEKTAFFSPYDSKYDRYLNGEYTLTDQEELGKALFFSNNNTNCSICHALKSEDSKKEPFTTFEYFNIGIPVNAAVRLINKKDKSFIDYGLFDNPMTKENRFKGLYRTPTLRNVAITGPYMHNGVFKDLRTVIAFYDQYNNHKRTLNPETGKNWQDPEVAENLNLKELRAKKLTDVKIDALVAFLKILTDKRYEHLIK